MTYTIKNVGVWGVSYDAHDGSGHLDRDDEFVVLDERGNEVYRCYSLMAAERWVARLNSKAKRRVA